MGGFTPSTVPGCRAPHFWLPDGRSLYDAFGQGYTLLRLDRVGRRRRRLQAAARARRCRSRCWTSRAAAPDAYRHKLLLVRDDQHVAWRSDALPADAEALVATLCGAGRPSMRLDGLKGAGGGAPFSGLLEGFLALLADRRQRDDHDQQRRRRQQARLTAAA